VDIMSHGSEAAPSPEAPLLDPLPPPDDPPLLELPPLLDPLLEPLPELEAAASSPPELDPELPPDDEPPNGADDPLLDEHPTTATAPDPATAVSPPKASAITKELRAGVEGANRRFVIGASCAMAEQDVGPSRGTQFMRCLVITPRLRATPSSQSVRPPRDKAVAPREGTRSFAAPCNFGGLFHSAQTPRCARHIGLQVSPARIGQESNAA